MEESESQTSCVPLSPVELLCDLIIELEEPVEDRSEKVLEIPLWVDERTLADCFHRLGGFTGSPIDQTNWFVYEERSSNRKIGVNR